MLITLRAVNILLYDHYKGQLIVLVYYPNEKQSTSYGVPFGSSAESFLCAKRRQIEKDFYTFGNVLTEGIFLATKAAASTTSQNLGNGEDPAASTISQNHGNDKHTAAGTITYYCVELF